MSVTVNKDLSTAFGPARDQGRRKTCMAFAASDAHAAARGNPAALSCEYAHYHAIRRKGSLDPESGVSLSIMAATIEQDGQPLETGWPYLIKLPANLAQWKPPSAPGQIFRRLSTPIASTVSDIVTLLDVDQPVVLTMRISISFWTPDPDWVVAGDPAEPTVGIHALVAVGHGIRAADRVILVRNSWGLGWAKQGYAWLTENYLTPRLYDATAMN